MKRIRTAIFSSTLMLSAGAFAMQYPAGSQTMPQSRQPQGSVQPAQPSQNPGAMQPQQQPNAPANQPSQQPQSSGQPRQGPSIDDQVQMLSNELSLSSDQQAKVKMTLEDQHAQAMEIVQNTTMSREDKIQKIHDLRESTIARVRTTLNDDQKKKLDGMIQQDQQTHSRDQQPSPQEQPSQPPPPK